MWQGCNFEPEEFGCKAHVLTYSTAMATTPREVPETSCHHTQGHVVTTIGAGSTQTHLVNPSLLVTPEISKLDLGRLLDRFSCGSPEEHHLEQEGASCSTTQVYILALCLNRS